MTDRLIHGLSLSGPERLPLAPGGLEAVGQLTPAFSVSEEARNLATLVAQLGGKGVMVGGWVRDTLLGGEPRDEDLEVFGIKPSKLARALGNPPQAVGGDFGIFKVGRLDVSFPRRRRKRGGGVEALQQDVDPELPLREAASRRDFTINALAWDPLSGALYDPYGGLRDLQSGLLRCVEIESLAEDPLRVLRAAQLVARMRLVVAPSTMVVLASMAPSLTLCAAERVELELERLLLKAVSPEMGWAVVRETGAARVVWPQLEGLGAMWPQALAALAHLGPWEAEVGGDRVGELATRLVVLGARLSPAVFGAFVSAATQRTRLFKTAPELHRLWRGVLALALSPDDAPLMGRLAQAASLEQLMRVAEAVNIGSALGREPRVPPSRWRGLRQQALDLGLLRGPAPPLLKGRSLIQAGFRPSATVGRLLQLTYLAQLDGRVTTPEEAVAYAQGVARLRGWS